MFIGNKQTDRRHAFNIYFYIDGGGYKVWKGRWGGVHLEKGLVTCSGEGGIVSHELIRLR